MKSANENVISRLTLHCKSKIIMNGDVNMILSIGDKDLVYETMSGKYVFPDGTWHKNVFAVTPGDMSVYVPLRVQDDWYDIKEEVKDYIGASSISHNKFYEFREQVLKGQVSISMEEENGVKRFKIV